MMQGQHTSLNFALCDITLEGQFDKGYQGPEEPAPVGEPGRPFTSLLSN